MENTTIATIIIILLCVCGLISLMVSMGFVNRSSTTSLVFMIFASLSLCVTTTTLLYVYFKCSEGDPNFGSYI